MGGGVGGSLKRGIEWPFYVNPAPAVPPVKNILANQIL